MVSEVVPDFRTVSQLRGLFELCAQLLVPGGRLVLNTFLPRLGYTPDDAARELGQQFNSMIFTRDEVDGAVSQLPWSSLPTTPPTSTKRPPARGRLAAHRLVRRVGQRPRHLRRGA